MATKKEIERAEAIENLKNWLPELTALSSFVEFSTEYGKGQTDYVSVKVYHQKDGRGHVADLGYNVSKACGYPLRRGNWTSQLALGGGGYSKSYDVALSMLHVLGLEKEQVNFSY